MIQKVNKKIKFLIAVIGSLLMTSVSAFGMYGLTSDWMDFLVDGNKLKARMDQLGFTLGNGTIKGTFGFRADKGAMGAILTAPNNAPADLHATISAGIGYTSDLIGIGLGYNFTYYNKNLQVHTPVLAVNALNNNFRLVAPIQVAVTDNLYGTSVDNIKYTGVAFDGIQLRYYTGIDAFNAIRLYVFYRNNTYEDKYKETAEALGFQLRLYFLNTQIGNVAVNPFIRLEYHTALKGHQIKDYRAGSTYNGLASDEKQSDIYKVNPYEFSIKPVLSLSASSDYVSVYFEPSLGYKLSGFETKGFNGEKGFSSMNHVLTWGAYAELYVTPVKDLEWYFEMDVNGDVTGKEGYKANANLSPVHFETTTGITWYLPSLGGDTAQ